MGLLRGFDNARCQRIHAKNATEDIDQHSLHVFIAQQDLESMRNLFGIRAATDVEEVRRHSARKLDDVHRRHCEARHR